MYIKALLLFFISSTVYANEIPNREPDVKSQPANLEDYYTYDKETGQWIWKEDYGKFKKKRNAEKKAKLKAIAAKKECEPCPVCPSITKEKQGIQEVLPSVKKSEIKEKGFFGKAWDKTKNVWELFKEWISKIVIKVKGFICG